MIFPKQGNCKHYRRLKGIKEEAVALVKSGLVIALEINSERLMDRVEKIYQDLKESPYTNSPDVARLEYLLRKRKKSKK